MLLLRLLVAQAWFILVKEFHDFFCANPRGTLKSIEMFSFCNKKQQLHICIVFISTLRPKASKFIAEKRPHETKQKASKVFFTFFVATMISISWSFFIIPQHGSEHNLRPETTQKSKKLYETYFFQQKCKNSTNFRQIFLLHFKRSFISLLNGL